MVINYHAVTVSISKDSKALRFTIFGISTDTTDRPCGCMVSGTESTDCRGEGSQCSALMENERYVQEREVTIS